MDLFYNNPHPSYKDLINLEWRQLKKDLREPIAHQVYLILNHKFYYQKQINKSYHQI